MGRNHVVLASDEGLALRIGKRHDADPVLLTVNVDAAHERGCMFLKASPRLFLCRFVPEGTFRGPALPKEKKTKDPKDGPAKAATDTSQRSQTPGSYFPDLTEELTQKHLTKKQRRRDEVAWKSARRRKSRRKP